MMFSNSKISKIVSSLLVFVLVVNSFLFIALWSPKPAQAQIATTEVASVPQTIWKTIKTAFDKAKAAVDKAFQKASLAFDSWSKSEKILDQVSYSLLYITTSIILQKMTQNIVTWLEGGAKGTPKVLPNFEDELKNAVDFAAGSVVGSLLGLNDGELCNPNFVKVTLSLALDPLQAPTFEERFKCSFTGGIQNLKRFQEDFSNGGWRSWISYTRGTNNKLYQAMEASREIRKRQLQRTEATKSKIAANNGFVSQENCIITKPISAAIEVRFQASGGPVVGEKTFGRSVVGMNLADVMSTYGYSNVNDFKAFWEASGGEYKCRVETPGAVISELGKKVITDPLDNLNRALTDTMSQIGSKAPSFFQPYINAISTAAINLLIQKEKGLISGALSEKKPRRYKRQSTKVFKDASSTLFASEGMLESAKSLRDTLMQTVLNFSLFTGTLISISENKSILWEQPILVKNLIQEGYIWSEGFKSGNYTNTGNIWMGQPDYPQDPSDLSTRYYDEDIAERVSYVVRNINNDESKGYPLLPAAGTFKTAANICGAFTQDIEPERQDLARQLSKAVGFVALEDIPINESLTYFKGSIVPLSLSSQPGGWFYIGGQKIRVIAFNDSDRVYKDGSRWPDRYVRQNATTGEVVTFIDTLGNDGTIFTTSTSSPDIFNADLATITQDDPRVYYVDPNDSNNSNKKGDVYYIKGNRNEIKPITSDMAYGEFWFDENEDGSDDLSTTIRPYPYPSVGLFLPEFPNPLPTGTNITPNPLFSNIFTAKVLLLDGTDVTTKSSSKRRPGAVAIACNPGYFMAETTCTYLEKQRSGGNWSIKPSAVRIFGGTKYCTAASPAIGKDEKVQVMCTKTPPSTELVDSIGIPAYISDVDYQIKFFSPTYEGATALISNKRRIIEYDDFRDPVTNKPITMISATSTLDNVNPYKMGMLEFYPEINEMTNKFMQKIRVLVGYPKYGNLTKGFPNEGENVNTDKFYLSSLASQIGEIPDDDPGYTSVSDVLERYNKLSELYQTLFSGVSSENTLEGLDPKFEILTPEESNIKLALIGQRCPSTPPLQEDLSDPLKSSSIDLIEGCGFIEQINELGAPEKVYNMGKRFMFKKDNITGFATNPFVGGNNAASSVLAGILNLDEMTQQLRTLPPDTNIIKLIRIRQILEQLQVAPQPITAYGKTRSDDVTVTPRPLFGVDLVQVSLRNYPEIERFLNETTTTFDPVSGKKIPGFKELDGSITPYVKIDKLIELYGFSPDQTREAYAKISADLENVLPDIVIQIQDKLKEVFLKRVERELEKAKKEATERIVDFIHFARDLNPSVQVQVPKGFGGISVSSSIDMQIGPDKNSDIIRVITSVAETDDLAVSAPYDNCLNLQGEKINDPDKNNNNVNCEDEDEFKLKGFKVDLWNKLSEASGSPLYLDETANINQEEALEKIAIRKAIMAGIRQKIKDFYEIMGKDTGTFEFERFIGYYKLLPYKDTHTLNNDGHDGSENHVHISGNYPQSDGTVKDGWDTLIEKGLQDVYVLYTGYYNEKLGKSSPGTILNSTGKSINNDVRTTIKKMSEDFSLLQKEIDKIRSEFADNSQTSIFSLKENLKDLNSDFSVMSESYVKALACVRDGELDGGSGNIVLVSAALGGAAGAGIAGLAIGGPIGLAAGFLIGGWLAKKKKKKLKRKARKIANRCGSAATDYNKALVSVANNFICGL